MMFYLGFFVGWVIGVFCAFIFLYIVCRKKKSVVEEVRPYGEHTCWGDTFYVEVATGKYFFASDLMKEYGKNKLRKLVADGTFVNEGHWEKIKEKRK